jgi:hypothetical protein
MPAGIPTGARCVQRFDDSRNYAIHITFRNSLRSSSLREPRDPLLKVVLVIVSLAKFNRFIAGTRIASYPQVSSNSSRCVDLKIGNDPSAGSPTETLLRLLLPLNDQV